jgi:hypothetical protein
MVRNTVARLELQSGKKLKAVRTDQGIEYLNGEMAAYFGEKGVIHQSTARYSPEQNGVAERLKRVLMERARAMLIESGLPDEMWAEAVVTANYIRNRTPVSAHGKMPWDALYEKKPDVSHMRVFGARAFMHVPGALRHKLEPVSEKGWFIVLGGPGMICHLKKTLYGLRQAPRAWHTRLKAELKALCFRASEIDPALFVKGAERQATYVLVWIDDILVAGLDREEIAAVKKKQGEAKKKERCSGRCSMFAIWRRRRTSLGWR